MRIESFEHLTDEELCARIARDGDRGCFRELFERYAGKLLGFLSQTLSPDLAADCLQVVWMKAWTALLRGDYQERGSLLAWLYAIARNEVINQVRLRKAWLICDEDAVAAASVQAVSEAAVDARRTLERFDVLLRREPAQTQAVARYWLERGYSVQSIATALNITVHRAKRHKVAIMKLLKKAGAKPTEAVGPRGREGGK